MDFDGTDWQRKLSRALQAVAWAIYSIISTVFNYSPSQLVFPRDMIMQTKLTGKSNERENKDCLAHNYQLGDKGLILLKDNDEVLANFF